jgi:hypothetical protein
MSLTVEAMDAMTSTATSAVSDLVDARDARDAVFADEESTEEDRLAAEAEVDTKGRAITLLRQRFDAMLRAEPDYSSPRVLFVDPVNGANGVSITPTIRVGFDRAMNADTMTAGVGGCFGLFKDDGTPADEQLGVIEMDESGSIATLTMADAEELAVSTRYHLGVTQDACDENGNPLWETYRQTTGFSTENSG